MPFSNSGMQPSGSNQNTQLGETQASFNARIGNLQHVIGQVPGIATNGLVNGSGHSIPQPSNDPPSTGGMRSAQEDTSNYRSRHERGAPSTAPAGADRERYNYDNHTKDMMLSLVRSLRVDALLTP